jgi:hypothetical protein
MTLTKKNLKKAYNSLLSNTKIRRTFVLNNNEIMIYTKQKITDSKYINPLAYFNILSVYYNETKGILESTQYTKNPDAVLNYVNYTLNNIKK